MTFGTPRSRDEGRERRRVGLEDLAEDLERGNTGRPCGGADLRHPGAEERPIDVLRRVDAEAVDLVRADPVAPHLREPVHDERLLGEDVVEPEEVALLEARRRARREIDVAAVVVPRDVVEPGRPLQIPLLRQHDRLARLVARREAREALAAGEPLRGVRLALAVAVRLLVGRAVRRPAREEDHVGGVVHDDVEVDLQPEAVRAVGERLEVRVRAEVRVDLREVEPPVAVVRRAVALHPLLHDDRARARSR